jgi:hypothetical protein
MKRGDVVTVAANDRTDREQQVDSSIRSISRPSTSGALNFMPASCG